MTSTIERVGVVGAGAMGGMYAAHFAKAGFDVRFVARGERAARLRDAQLVVNGEPVHADVIDADAPEDWAADLLLFAVKDGQLDAALDDAASTASPSTIVLSVLNGLDSEERIAERLGDGATVLLCVALAMDAERIDGEIRYRQAGKLVFGRPHNDEISPEVQAVQETLTRAGLAWETPVDMRHRLWWKFMVNVGINQASAVLDAPYGDFQHDGDARALMSALVDEVVAVANAEGVALGLEDVEAWHRVLAGQPVDGRTSMHQDVRAGRPTEVDSFGGRVVALGLAHGIPTPFNQAMVWILRARARDAAA
ncbi:2-dehydropantoate 2-reductase [Microbacterium sp. KR10-403]|uniref:ketopantoate reductase family protein n=1 Tax=Microbacterium sp. KR10-403 TaxID=3158581 RepID=UPI0032E4D8C6